MRIEIHMKSTLVPATMWNDIKKKIAGEKIKTWSIVKDAAGKEYLTHNPPQWFKKALLESATATNPTRLILSLTWFSNSIPNEYTKGLYIGRFTEELLEHYRDQYIKLETFA